MSEQRTFYLQWNFVNWITVIFMVMVGFTVLAAITSMVRQGVKGGSSDDE